MMTSADILLKGEKTRELPQHINVAVYQAL